MVGNWFPGRYPHIQRLRRTAWGWALALAAGACAVEPLDLGAPDTSTDAQVRHEEGDAGPRVPCPGDSSTVHFRKQDIEALRGCTHASGRISLMDGTVPAATLEGLSSLQVAGSLGVFRDNELTDLGALANLRRVGDFSVRFAPHFEGFPPRLDAVEAEFLLEDLPRVTRLPNMGRTVRLQRLSIGYLSALESLSGLEHLEEIDGDLRLTSLGFLTSLEGLRSLRRVGGDVSIRRTARLPREEVERFLERIEVGGDIDVD